jgi:succinate dehydrogenase/fumarate reductase flavoprotein subunit
MANNGDKHHWDKETDVIVVGYGAAGGISAITAHDAGAKVLLI